MIKGITVTLINRVQTGVDAFNHPIYEKTETIVNNVLVSPISGNEVTNATDLEGKRLAYTLAIPKKDTNNWEDCEVRFWGHTFKSYGHATEGIEENIPLVWNKKVTVELYE